MCVFRWGEMIVPKKSSGGATKCVRGESSKEVSMFSECVF